MATNSTNFIKLYPDKNQYWEVWFFCHNRDWTWQDTREKKTTEKGLLGGGGGKRWAGEESCKEVTELRRGERR